MSWIVFMVYSCSLAKHGINLKKKKNWKIYRKNGEFLRATFCPQKRVKNLLGSKGLRKLGEKKYYPICLLLPLWIDKISQ
jgi:hypothetical protein